MIVYARTGPEVIPLTDFGVSRGYVPDQIAEGGIEEILKHVSKGDTLLVETMEVFNVDGWGGARVSGDFLKKGVTVVTRAENFVLKDDMQSTVLMAMTCMTTMLRTHPDNNLT
ncbi:hypothetical protein AB4Y95_00335 [Arthrobacter sp. M-10]|uniref:hypothetical protein n=1 Tax=Arthrobacter sp. M-10 TaxID=3233037 RepID=UPI003F9227E3